MGKLNQNLHLKTILQDKHKKVNGENRKKVATYMRFSVIFLTNESKRLLKIKIKNKKQNKKTKENKRNRLELGLRPKPRPPALLSLLGTWESRDSLGSGGSIEKVIYVIIKK